MLPALALVRKDRDSRTLKCEECGAEVTFQGDGEVGYPAFAASRPCVKHAAEIQETAVSPEPAPDVEATLPPKTDAAADTSKEASADAPADDSAEASTGDQASTQ